MRRIWIDEPGSLADHAARWREAEILGIDTEFVRERTFFPRLGLIQVRHDEVCALVDPVALRDLSPLAEVLVAPDVVKVAHSPSEDYEALYHELGVFPRPLFDTQTAAALAGHGHSLGYQSLVESLLGVELEKGETRTNWLRRPLSDAQLHYAAQDVIHLPPLYDLLRDELAGADRLRWVFEETERLAAPERFLPDPGEALWRLGGIGRLNRRQLAAARELAAWREREARSRDLPRGFVLRDASLLELARRLPVREEELPKIRDLHPRQIEREGHTLLDLVRRARDLPPHELPETPPRLPRSEEISRTLQEILDVVRSTAESLGIPGPSLASRREVKELVLAIHASDNGEPPPPPFDGWRWEVLREPLEPLLDRLR